MPVGRQLAIGLLVLCAAAALAEEPAPPAGLSRSAALALGERLFREGILPSGEPVQAVVAGDIPVDGSMFTCSSCHLRSGVGSIEGSLVTLPTNAEWLFKPLEGVEMRAIDRQRIPERFVRRFRPAYTDETLARALVAGVGAGGTSLNRAMPRYSLSPRDLEILLFYLKNLSAATSPGVDDQVIRFAIVVTPEVSPELADLVVRGLEAHARDHNSQTRNQELRARFAPPHRGEFYSAYRRLKLLRWDLHGPPTTWPEQLRALYEREPVFALLGGISTTDWGPIHEFCEANLLPSLFPLTDYPVVSTNDWYTLYFSKGFYQEGEALAKYIRAQLPAERPVLQVYRGTEAGRALARGLRETLSNTRSTVEDWLLEPDQIADAGFWKTLEAKRAATTLVLWLDGNDLSGLSKLASGGESQPIFVSSTLLAEDLTLIPNELRESTFLTFPRSLPTDKARARGVAKHWAQSRGLISEDLDLLSKLYTIGWMLSGALREMGGDFYRDYLLDVFDMRRDENYNIAAYPRLSFGPGQRYTSKGCYVGQLVRDSEPRFVPRTDWIIH